MASTGSYNSSSGNDDGALAVIGTLALAGFAFWLFYKLGERNAKAKRETQEQAKQEAPGVKESTFDNGNVIDVSAEKASVNTASSTCASPMNTSVLALPVLEPVKPDIAPFHHSDGFRLVVQKGITYKLTLNQSLVLEKLWNALQSHLPEVHQSVLFEGICSCNYKKRLRDIFKCNMTAFRALIAKGERKGFFKLKFN